MVLLTKNMYLVSCGIILLFPQAAYCPKTDGQYKRTDNRFLPSKVSLNKTPVNQKNTQSDSESKFYGASHHNNQIYPNRFSRKGKWVVAEPPSRKTLRRKENGRLLTLERRKARYVKAEKLSIDASMPFEDDELGFNDLASDSESPKPEPELFQAPRREFAILRQQPILLEDHDIQIFVKTLVGSTVVLRVETSDTVMRIKELLLERQGVPVGQQRLIYGGKQLDDDRILEDYNIQPESTIHLALRLIGGKADEYPEKPVIPHVIYCVGCSRLHMSDFHATNPIPPSPGIFDEETGQIQKVRVSRCILQRPNCNGDQCCSVGDSRFSRSTCEYIPSSYDNIDFSFDILVDQVDTVSESPLHNTRSRGDDPQPEPEPLPWFFQYTKPSALSKLEEKSVEVVTGTSESKEEYDEGDDEEYYDEGDEEYDEGDEEYYDDEDEDEYYEEEDEYENFAQQFDPRSSTRGTKSSSGDKISPYSEKHVRSVEYRESARVRSQDTLSARSSKTSNVEYTQ